jgi:VanZ family protein
MVVAIAVSSVVPQYDRVTTFLPQYVEHLLAFIILSAAFGLAYPFRFLAQTVALLLFAAVIELAQLWAPGRHARWSDFFVDVLGLCGGIGLAYLVTRRTDRS